MPAAILAGLHFSLYALHTIVQFEHLRQRYDDVDDLIDGLLGSLEEEPVQVIPMTKEERVQQLKAMLVQFHTARLQDQPVVDPNLPRLASTQPEYAASRQRQIDAELAALSPKLDLLARKFVNNQRALVRQSSSLHHASFLVFPNGLANFDHILECRP